MQNKISGPRFKIMKEWPLYQIKNILQKIHPWKMNRYGPYIRPEILRHYTFLLRIILTIIETYVTHQANMTMADLKRFISLAFHGFRDPYSWISPEGCIQPLVQDGDLVQVSFEGVGQLHRMDQYVWAFPLCLRYNGEYSVIPQSIEIVYPGVCIRFWRGCPLR